MRSYITQDDGAPADRSRVSLRETWHVRYWTGRFDCTLEQLERAIDAVGPSTLNVIAYLTEFDPHTIQNRTNASQ